MVKNVRGSLSMMTTYPDSNLSFYMHIEILGTFLHILMTVSPSFSSDFLKNKESDFPFKTTCNHQVCSLSENA